MANSNAELEAFMSVHNETLKARAHHVAPPSKEYKQLILEQLMKEVSRVWDTTKGTISYEIIRKVKRK